MNKLIYLLMFVLLISFVSATDLGLNYTYDLADIEYGHDPIIQINEVGSQMKWNSSSIPADVTIDNATLCLWIWNVIGTMNNNVRVWYIPEEWDEQSGYGDIESQSKLNETDEILSSIADDSWTCFNVTQQLRHSYFIGDVNFTVRFEDPDNLVPAIEDVSDFGMRIGDQTASDYFYFEDREDLHSTGNRPTLNITYTELAPPRIGINWSYPLTGSQINVTSNSTLFNVSVQVCCFDANCGDINMSLDPIKEEIVYTPLTRTVCNNNICTKTLYSGTRFVDEDGWKPIEEAKSLKNTEIKCVVNYDGVHYAECLDFNYTHKVLSKISLNETKIDECKLSVSPECDIAKEVDISDVPIKSIRKEWNIIKNDFDEVALSSISRDFSKTKEQDIVIKSDFGGIVRIGEHSTTIMLQEENTTNMEDTWIDKEVPDTNWGYYVDVFYLNFTDYTKHGFYKFNLTSLPYNKIVLNSMLCLHMRYNQLDSGETLSIAAHHLYSNYSWTEHSLTWNTWLFSPGIFNETKENSETFDNTSSFPSEEWYSFNVTNITMQETSNNLSFFLETYEGNCGFSDYIRFKSKEALDPLLRPYLNITYELVLKGIITNTTTDIPFVIHGSSYNITNLNQGECMNQTWTINATGAVGSLWNFFAMANSTTDATINNQTGIVSVTIREYVPPDLTAPQWSNNVTNISLGIEYHPLRHYQFNITWDENVSPVIIEHNFTVTATNLTNTTMYSTNDSAYQYNHIQLKAGHHFWRSYANDSSNNLNQSTPFLFEVSLNSTADCNIQINDSAVDEGQHIKVGYSSNYDMDATLYANDSQISNDTVYAGLAIGQYNFSCILNNTENYTIERDDFILTVGAAYLPCRYFFVENASSGKRLFEIDCNGNVNFTNYLWYQGIKYTLAELFLTNDTESISLAINNTDPSGNSSDESLRWFNDSDYTINHLNGTSANFSGNITGNQISGEMWNHTDAGYTFAIAAANIYYNLTGLLPGRLNGFTFTNALQINGGSYMTTLIDGSYSASLSISFAGGNTKDYEVGISKRVSGGSYFDEISKCQGYRTGSGGIGSMSTTCHLELAVGDDINIQIENEDTNQDATVHYVNLNLVRIGD